ncbi:MAG: hypothetical protein KC620_17105, partial [Myxococcales bacterium]|nr:hypothetical protein [Myxococcales bacterium]
IAYDKHPTNDLGLSGLLTVDARLFDWLAVGLAGRLSWLTLDEEDFDAPSVQQEVWLRAGFDHHGHGARLVGGRLSSDTDTIAEGALVVGAQAWFTAYATLRLEGALTRYNDGAATQVSAAVYLPLLRHLHLEGGAQMTRYTLDEPQATTMLVPAGPPPPPGAPPPAMVEVPIEPGTLVPVEYTDGTPHWSGFATAHLRFDAFNLSVGGRLGTEVRPVRLAEPTLWNIDDALTGSAYVQGTVPLSDAFTLFAGYEINRLDTEAEPNALIQTLTTGLVVTYGVSP